MLSSRRLDQLESTLLAERANYPFISPDGQWVGYGAQTTLRKVAITGGSSLDIVQLDGGMRGATWGTDDTIVLATTALETGLLRVPSSGGTPSVLTRPDKAKGEGDHVLPRWVPGVNAVLFTVTSAEGGPNSETSQIAVLDLRTAGAVPRTVLRGGSDARYVPTGHLVYVAGNSLWAVPFDTDRLEVKGSAPVPVLTSMAAMAGVVGVFDIAADGTLVYLPASALESPARRLVWVDRQGKEIDLGAPPKPYAYPRISPDGTRVAIDVREGDSDIWVLDLPRGNATRVSTDPGLDRDPLWLDQDRLIYSSMSDGNPGLVVQRADGSGTPERLSRPEAPGSAHFPHSLVPGGKKVVFIATAGPTGNDLMVLDLDRRAPTKTAPSLRDVQPLVSDPLSQANGVVSPDGRWLAYQSNESGSFEVYVRPFPDTNSGLRHTVSNDGGTQPRWSATGRELFYVALRTNTMMAVPIGTGPSWSAGVPAPLFSTSQYSLGLVFPYVNYDVAKDGRFLVVKPQSGSSEVETSASLVVVQHWFEELKRLVPR